MKRLQKWSSRGLPVALIVGVVFGWMIAQWGGVTPSIAQRSEGELSAKLAGLAEGELPPGLQELEESIDRGEIHKRGWGLVRRPTGGRAILHDDEVTYSVCLPQQLLPQGDSVVQSYRELSRGIEAGLQLLGVAAELGAKHDQQKRTGRRQPVICFAQTARVDMTVAGRKIVGSAQVRRDGIILQHGSIPLTLDWAAHLAVMPPRDSSQGGPGLRQAAVPVADAVERPVSFDEVCEALIAGFSEVLGIAVAETPLTPQEQQRAARLRAEKYATDAWNLTPPSRR